MNSEVAPETPNIGLVRDLYRCFREKDTARLREILSPEVVWSQSPGFPGGRVRHGPDEVISGVMGAFDAEWEGWRFRPERFLDAGHAVVVLGAYTAVHRETGRALSSETAHVYDIRGGRVAALTQYSDTAVIQRAAAP